ncbi:AsmA family protein [Labilibaculum euxinus]
MKLTKGKIIIGSIAIVLFFIFLMLSAIVRYWVNKNSEELIGRKIEISELHFNYAKVSARVKGFRLYELDGNSNFVSFDELYVNINPWKLLAGEYSVSEIYLDGLNVSVIKNLEEFNFSDLIKEDNSQAVDSTNLKEDNELVKFEIRNIEIKNGHVNYLDQEKDNNIDLKNINIELPLIAWNNDKSEMGVNFSMGKTGNVSINADIDHSIKRYTINLGVTSLDISPFVVYLKDYMMVSKMEGLLDTKLNINGSMNDFMDVFVKGDAALQEFSIYDSEENPFVSAKAAKVVLDSLHIGSSHYKIGRVSMDSPVIYADLYSDDSNFEKIFEPYLKSDTLSVDTIAKEELESSLFYQLDTIVLTKGVVKFTDHTLNRKFVYDLHDININMGTVNADVPKIPVAYSMNLNGGGKSSGSAVFSLKDTTRFNIRGKIERLDLMSFSPYTEFYIARPITQGELTYDCSLDMTSVSLKNMNKIKVSEFDFGNKTKDPNTIKAPVRLALYLLKDQNDQIKFDLPVSGNPKDPEFRVGKIIWKTFMNFLVKTASKPFGLLGNLVGSNPESIEKIPFHFLQDSLDAAQINTLETIADILKKKPDLKFSFSQETNIGEERILLAVRECANRFFQSTAMEEKIILNLQLMEWANNSPEFRTYIFNQDKSSAELSIQDNCVAIIGEQEISILFDKLYEKRNQFVSNHLINNLLVDVSAFEMKRTDLRNLSEEQRTPNFRVEVSLQ